MSKYRFDLMEIGDTLRDTSGGSASGTPGYQNKMYMAAVMYGRRNGKRFSGKTITGGVIVERIA